MDKKQINRKNARNNRNSKNSPKKKVKAKKGKKIALILLVLFIMLGGIFAYRTYKNGGGLSGMLATVVGHDENTKKNLGEFQTLILGISTDEAGSLLTDTIMVASYNPNTQKATLLSIPRDTYTGRIPAKATAYEKINALYSRKEDPQMVLHAINDITGLHLQNYMIVKTEAFIKLVDAIGGVTFDVPIDMDYDDASQDLHIHLKAGEQKLDGDKAEQLVRFRHNNDNTTYPDEYGNNDEGRMRTQREFITQVLKQTLKPGNIFHLGKILDIANECIITNIQISEAKDYVPYAVEFNTENLTTGVLPGTNTNKNSNKVWVFVHDKEKTKELIQELFVDRDREENSQIQEGNIVKSQIQESEIQGLNKAEIKIEILNATGEGKLLQKAVDKLEKAGYDVTRASSTSGLSQTTIINKNNVRDSTLLDIKEQLGVGTTSKDTTISASSKVDITIILGKDYQ